MSDLRGQGLKFDGDKLRPSLLPVESLESILEVLEFGAKKYKANSWQTVPDGNTRYMDALMRHVFAINKGEDLDSESGLPHLAHAGCCLLFLLYLRKQNESETKRTSNESELHKQTDPYFINEVFDGTGEEYRKDLDRRATLALSRSGLPWGKF